MYKHIVRRFNFIAEIIKSFEKFLNSSSMFNLKTSVDWKKDHKQGRGMINRSLVDIDILLSSFNNSLDRCVLTDLQNT